MKFIYYCFLSAALLLARGATAQVQTAEKLLVVSPAVGEVIDGGEKARFGLFLYYAADDFLEASFYRALSPDSSITLRSRLRDGRQLARAFTQAEFLGVRTGIEQRLKELGDTPAAPASAGTPGTAAPAAGSAASATSGDYNFVLGQTYRIETRDGTTFSGQLVSMSLTALDFDSKALGKVTVQRVNITKVDAEAVSVTATRSNYYDIGNGNRLFFGPTGRGLRKGEGVAQDVLLYLAGVNYGITDNLSLGGYLSLVPGLALQDQLLIFTPKLSVKLQPNVSAAAGVMYLRVPDFNIGSTGAGIGYGALTYGGADNNITGGLGYAFADDEVSSAPIVMVGAQGRVGRRVSLVSENYLLGGSEGALAGLYGMKINWRRASLGLGAVYFYLFPQDDGFFRQEGEFFTSYFVPLYIDFSFRFGKGANITK